MTYYSTNNKNITADFRQATITGQAPDKGLYYPSDIPVLPQALLNGLSELSKEEIAFTVIRPYVAGTIPDDVLHKIVSETINFNFPLIPINETISALELFHGPTLAFKDVGARFMSRCLGYFNGSNNQKVTVLVATSGDTGGAVANGFEGVEGVEVIILYPSGKVSPVQEKQLTTCGDNIIALEVDGVFDDCQAMVKQAFLDSDLHAQYQLTSANSINVARWLPQQFYYFFAAQQWRLDEAPVICVPSGNFGNICAGMVAHKSGLPVKHFIAACNANDTIYQYLQTGIMPEKGTTSTISNAMDVAKPSNFVRIMEMYNNSLRDLLVNLSAAAVSDEVTLSVMREVYSTYGYTLDPHGAVAYKALSDYLKINGGAGYLLETAHPVKFPEPVEQATGQQVPIPATIAPIMQLPKRSIAMANSYIGFKDWMMHRR